MIEENSCLSLQIVSAEMSGDVIGISVMQYLNNETALKCVLSKLPLYQTQASSK